MKKFFLLLTISFIFLTNVKADTIDVLYQDSVEWFFSNCGSGETACTTFLKPEYINSKYDIEYMYQELMSKYVESYETEYPYYFMNFINESKPNGELYYNRLVMNLFKNIPTSEQYISYVDYQISIKYDGDTYIHSTKDEVYTMPNFTSIKRPVAKDTNYYYDPMLLYDSNFEIKNVSGHDFVVSSINLIVNNGSNYVTYKNSSFDNQYIEVNLDDYEYVILNLKDYSSTSAFETNLQVKGSIAITPVYEFGTVEKENITDVCNTSYSDFTNYRFFILKNDLINNAVYIVKNCQSESSSFKFDSTVFDVTYVTAENVDDPVITFGGVEYHTIPFEKLSNTVNKNEEEGYIPGASEGFDPFGNFFDYIKSFWNSLTTFMGLVTKFFNTLPIEIRSISITMFTTAITLGVIKFIKS